MRSAPREQIGLLFLCGGLASLAAMRLGGIWIDRGQALTVILLSSFGLALTTLLGFATPIGLSIYLVFVLFMAASAVRTGAECIRFARQGEDVLVGITAGASCPNNLIEETIFKVFELRGVDHDALASI